jgi:Zn-finger nucleic acid-binding protein
MKCPDCQSALHPTEMGEVEVDHCQACAGTWFDEGELERVRRAVGATDARLKFTPTDGPGGPCPRCVGARLAGGVVAAASVGRCPRCKGVWVRNTQERSGSIDGIGATLQIVAAVLECFP